MKVFEHLPLFILLSNCLYLDTAIFSLLFLIDTFSEHGSHAKIKNIKNDGQVYNALVPIAYRWKDIAMSLFTDVNDTKRIEQEYIGCNDRLFEVILYWKRHSHPSFTWNTLVKVLREPSINENAIATTVEQKYITHIISS